MRGARGLRSSRLRGGRLSGTVQRQRDTAQRHGFCGCAGGHFAEGNADEVDALAQSRAVIGTSVQNRNVGDRKLDPAVLQYQLGRGDIIGFFQIQRKAENVVFQIHRHGKTAQLDGAAAFFFQAQIIRPAARTVGLLILFGVVRSAHRIKDHTLQGALVEISDQASAVRRTAALIGVGVIHQPQVVKFDGQPVKHGAGDGKLDNTVKVKGGFLLQGGIGVPHRQLQ